MRRGRTQQRRRRWVGSYPLQLAAAVTLVLFATWMGVLLVEKAAHPYWLGYTEGRKVTAMRERLAEQKARNAQLRARIEYLRSPEGTETLARRKGYRKPGEQVYFLTDTPAAVPGGEEGR